MVGDITIKVSARQCRVKLWKNDDCWERQIFKMTKISFNIENEIIQKNIVSVITGMRPLSCSEQ